MAEQKPEGAPAGDAHSPTTSEIASPTGEAGEKQKGRDLFAIIATNTSAVPDQQDINVLVLGNKKVGKSTIVQRFARREDQSVPKPTTALEYSHAKREERNQVKMANFWELGGGQQLASLVDVVITPENIHTILVIIVVDLTEGRNVFNSLSFWMHRLKKRVGDCFVKMKQRGSSTPGKMLARMQKRFGEKHPDLEANKITIIGLPMVFLCTKYDIFKDEGTEQAKIMSKTLRYWAHTYASALLWVSTKDEKDLVKLRQLLNHLIFAVAFTGTCEFDTTKTLNVLPGKDSLKEIGPPAQCQRPSGFQSTGNEELDKWKAAFETIFPPVKGEKDSKTDVFDVMNPEWAWKAVDDLRTNKDEELEQYRQKRRKAAEDAARREAKARADAEKKKSAGEDD